MAVFFRLNTCFPAILFSTKLCLCKCLTHWPQLDTRSMDFGVRHKAAKSQLYYSPRPGACSFLSFSGPRCPHMYNGVIRVIVHNQKSTKIKLGITWKLTDPELMLSNLYLWSSGAELYQQTDQYAPDCVFCQFAAFGWWLWQFKTCGHWKVQWE